MFVALIVLCQLGTEFDPAECKAFAAKQFFLTEADCQNSNKISGYNFAILNGAYVYDSQCVQLNEPI